MTFSLTPQGGTFDEIHVKLEGAVSSANVDEFLTEIKTELAKEPLKNVRLDVSDLNLLDGSGPAALLRIKALCAAEDNNLTLLGAHPELIELLDAVDLEILDSGILHPRPDPNLLVQIGDAVQTLRKMASDIIVFIGAIILGFIGVIKQPSTARWESIPKLIERNGVDAAPLVCALGFLMGAVLAFQAAIQLRKFGANIFVADLVSLSVTLEMGPLMTAIIVSGRSGAAFASQIGAMHVKQEIDALRVMGIDPVRYLVLPRIIAVGFSTPCLTLFANCLGIIGGCLVAMISLDLTPTVFFNQVHRVLEVTDVIKGLIKSFVFGLEIAVIGCHRGFQVRGGAESVGSATTSAVVTCIFVLTITDALFAVVYHYYRF